MQEIRIDRRFLLTCNSLTVSALLERRFPFRGETPFVYRAYNQELTAQNSCAVMEGGERICSNYLSVIWPHSFITELLVATIGF